MNQNITFGNLDNKKRLFKGKKNLAMVLVSFQALKKSASFIRISALYIIKDALSGS